MNNFKEGPIQCACSKFFRTKQTYSLHLGKCSQANSDEKEKKHAELLGDINTEGYSEKNEENKGVKDQSKEEPSIDKDNYNPVEEFNEKVVKPNEVKDSSESEKLVNEENSASAGEKSVAELEKEIEQLQEEIEKDEAQNNQEKVVKNDGIVVDDGKSTLDDMNKFTETNGFKRDRPDDKSEETSLNVKTLDDDFYVGNPDVSKESIEIVDSDEEEGKSTKSIDVSIDLTEEPDKKKDLIVNHQVVVDKQKKPKRKGRAPFKPKSCSYCEEQCHDRIGLAKHLISDHWETVRRAQGGGKLDRSAYYNQIQDSRIIRPKPPPMSARTSFHMKGLAGADAVNRAYQNPALQAKNPAWFQKLESANKLSGGSKLNFKNGLGNQKILPKPSPGEILESQNKMNSKQQANFKNYMSQKPNPYLLNKRNRNPHSPSWFGNPPTRNQKILPKPSSGEVLDLTVDEDPTCEICEDDFNWPDENHACPLKQNKKIKLEEIKNTTVPKKGGLSLLKEKIFNNSSLEVVRKTVKPTIEKQQKQFEASVSKIPSSTKLVPIDNRQAKTPSRVLPSRNLPTRNLPTRTLPSRNTSSRNIPERTVGTRTMPSRRVKTY